MSALRSRIGKFLGRLSPKKAIIAIRRATAAKLTAFAKYLLQPNKHILFILALSNWINPDKNNTAEIRYAPPPANRYRR